MGMYTELQLNCELKEKPSLIPHLLGEVELLDTPLWASHFMLKGISSYFPYDKPHSEMYEVAGFIFLTTKFNIKNYWNQIHHFLEYLHPYIEAIDGDFLGFCRYEEDELPTLLIYGVDKIEYKEVKK